MTTERIAAKPLAGRRIAAFAIDYAVIAAYLCLLGLAGFALRRTLGLEARPLTTPVERLGAQALGFTLLTLPVALYFAASESSPRGATLGERALGLRVDTVAGGRISFGRALLLAGVKFAPWELAHNALWQMPGAFTREAAPDAPHYVGFGLSIFLSGRYVSALFRRGGHTPYDRVAGTKVTVAR